MFLQQSYTWEVCVVGLSIILFNLVYIFSKPYKYNSDLLLGFWLVLLAFPLIESALFVRDYSFQQFSLYINPTINLLHGPLLLFYVRLLIQQQKLEVKHTDLYHFIPFVLFYLSYILMQHPNPMLPMPQRFGADIGPVAYNSASSIVQPLFTHFGFINAFTFIGYSVATIAVLLQHQKRIVGIFSQNDSQVSLKWVYTLPATFALLVIVNFTNETNPTKVQIMDPTLVHVLSFAIFSILLCFYGIRQQPVFYLRHMLAKEEFAQQTPSLDTVSTLDQKRNEIDNIDKGSDEDESSPVVEALKEAPPVESGLGEQDSTEQVRIEQDSTAKPEKAKIKLSDDEISEVVGKMQIFMQSDKPYLDPEFTVYSLAQSLKIPRRTLSLILSHGLSTNFYQYVNEFRIKEVKSVLKSQESGQMTILDVAFQCGFKSKSSFNSIFKQYCGLTPSQYRKKIRHQAEAASR